MCGRFTLRAPARTLSTAYAVEVPVEYTPRYNIAPGQPVLVVRARPESGAREALFVHWGLIPPWAEDPGIAYTMINARAETVAEKPTFSRPLASRRCLVPADGWYEWRKTGREKQPFFFHLKGGAPFAFAGLWERGRGKGGKEIESCTVITTRANEAAAAVHDRMPVLLGPDRYDVWLGSSVHTPEDLLSLMAPCPAGDLLAYPVGAIVNSARVDSPRCVEPLTG